MSKQELRDALEMVLALIDHGSLVVAHMDRRATEEDISTLRETLAAAKAEAA